MSDPGPASGPGLASDPELLAWLVLRRVQRGGVVRLGRYYLDHGLLLPGHLAGTADDLMETGLLALADPNPVTEVTRRIIVTELGQARYAVLDQQRWAKLRTGQDPPCRQVDLPPPGDQTL